MMSFRKPQTVKRFAGGRYVKGRWVADEESETLQIMASVQPVTNDDMQNLPEGKRIERAVKIYTDELLRVEGTDEQGDVILWQGREYRVIAIAPNQMTFITSLKAFAITLSFGHTKTVNAQEQRSSCLMSERLTPNGVLLSAMLPMMAVGRLTRTARPVSI